MLRTFRTLSEIERVRLSSYSPPTFCTVHISLFCLRIWGRLPSKKRNFTRRWHFLKRAFSTRNVSPTVCSGFLFKASILCSGLRAGISLTCWATAPPPPKKRKLKYEWIVMLCSMFFCVYGWCAPTLTSCHQTCLLLFYIISLVFLKTYYWSGWGVCHTPNSKGILRPVLCLSYCSALYI